ncbi:MAG: deoxyribodipyrimidine photo-lyase [Gammaproteobacteria bacterium]|jgi:deoxyribodipyrimidine photo-lyase
MANYKRSLFIFRRDLRLQDNTGLLQALASSEQVIPCFIFDPVQVKPHPYHSEPGFQFMLESLEDLDQQLEQNNSHLVVFHDEPARVIETLIARHKVEAVYVNRDYTPFSIKRDDKLARICEQNNVVFNQCNDALLIEPEYALKKDQTPYTVFTPFYRNARQYNVDSPQQLRAPAFYSKGVGKTLKQVVDKLVHGSRGYQPRGGRRKAMGILSYLDKFRDYDQQRNFPVQQGTTLLSAHNKFGTCSIREVYDKIKKALGADHPLLRQLYWRDFLTHIAFHFPHVFGESFRRQYDAIEWSNNRSWFHRWCNGDTGFPIVDAGMRELNETGYMHNRVRMITASFLVKDLHIDWRWGERYFARHLVDYDPGVNNGNWQWAASTGCDAQPYFRIFNPWLQQKKFDADCRYIKQWIPELADLSPKHIHNLSQDDGEEGYPAPVVDHSEQSRRIKALYKAVAR